MGKSKLDDNNIQSAVISWLRLPLIVMIVYIHSYGLPPVDASLPVIQSGVYEITRTVVSNMLCQSAVPCFFFISGFLFFYKVGEFSKDVYVGKLRKRFTTLLIPYLVWNQIALFMWFFREVRSGLSFADVWHNYLEKGLLSGFWSMYYVGGATRDWFGGETFLSGPADLPFWYLRDLIVVTLCSPVICFGVKKLGLSFVLLLALLFCSGVWQYPCPGLSTVALFFYSFGAYFSIARVDFVELSRRYFPFMAATYFLLLLTLLFFPVTNKWLFSFFRMVGVFVVFGIAAWFIDRTSVRFPSVLADSSFFIYAVHYVFFFSIVDDFVGWLLPVSIDWMHSLQYLVSPLLRVSLYIAVFWLMKHFVPKLTALLTGSRG
jgi:fucose 4-O-acetylase-like acetyltransferase